VKKSEFERLVDKAFFELEPRHGLKKTDTTFHKRGCAVRFQNSTTLVTLNYEITSLPWLEIADINDPEKTKSTLEWLLVEKGIEKSPTPDQAFEPTKMAETELEGVLQTKCQQLLEYGVPLLNGDFSIMPKLQDRARKYALACERYAKIHKLKK
jgi:hypothetical protein